MFTVGRNYPVRVDGNSHVVTDDLGHERVLSTVSGNRFSCIHTNGWPHSPIRRAYFDRTN